MLVGRRRCTDTDISEEGGGGFSLVELVHFIYCAKHVLITVLKERHPRYQ